MFFVVLAAALAAQNVMPWGDPAPVANPAIAKAPDSCCRIPAGMPVPILVTETVKSKTAKTGDHFALRLASPALIDGAVLLTADVTGVGEVIQAAPRRFSGAAGEPILAARYLLADGTKYLCGAFASASPVHSRPVSYPPQAPR